MTDSLAVIVAEFDQWFVSQNCRTDWPDMARNAYIAGRLAALAAPAGCVVDDDNESTEADAVHQRRRAGRAVSEQADPAPAVAGHVIEHARNMVDGHYPSHREYQVAAALLALTGQATPEGAS